MALKMRINVTPAASDNLSAIGAYIKDEFANSVAAKRAVKKIMKSYLNLSTSPYAGFSIKGKYGIDTPLRVLVSGEYLIVYEVKESQNIIEILKIYHSRQDYIKKIFPSFEYDIDEEDFADE